MKDHDTNRHPGPWRVMQVDSEFAGILLAVGFLVLGLVSMPIGTWFVVGCIVLGGVFALLLRFTPKKFTRLALGTLIVLVVAALWWAGRPPQRPHVVPSNAIHVEPRNVEFKLRGTGYWLKCWFDKDSNVDRCRLADGKGTEVFEDVFIPCYGQTPLPESELVFDEQLTGDGWIRSDEGINVPIVYLNYGRVLLPRSLYTKAKQGAGCSD